MLTEKLNDEVKDAMVKKEATRLDVLRGIKSAITNELVAKGKTPQDTLSDEEIVAVIQRLAKQRKDSIEQFRKGGREDLASKEEEELGHLQPFLPEMMPREEIERIAKEKQAELGEADKGKLMAALMRDLKGKADGTTVREVVDSLLA